MGLNLERMVGVVKLKPSPTSKIASQAKMYATEHYHQVDELA